jgi:hypothetical protein
MNDNLTLPGIVLAIIAISIVVIVVAVRGAVSEWRDIRSGQSTEEKKNVRIARELKRRNRR